MKLRQYELVGLPELGRPPRLRERSRDRSSCEGVQAPTHRTVASGARRQSCGVALGAQRCPGRAKSLRACENAAPLVEWRCRIRQQANSEQPWLGNACPDPLLRLDTLVVSVTDKN